MAECRGHAPLARRHALVSTEARFAGPVDIPEMVLAFGAANLRSNHEPADSLTGIEALDTDPVQLVRVAGVAPATFPV